MNNSVKRILVVCSKNQWRSKTAETIFTNHPTLDVKSAGTSSKAKQKINQALIDWADIILVMETKHKAIIVDKYLIDPDVIEVLGIPDEYKYMDDELISELTDTIQQYE
jgi:protein-tyrosine phosphatase